MRSLTRRVILLSISIGWAPLTLAQNAPGKQTQVVTTAAGGGADLVARVVAEALSAIFGQPAVVLNRPGSQVIPVMQVAKAAPDGYTLLSIGGNLFWLGPLLQGAPYDAVGDFSPISLTAKSPNIVVVHPSLPVTNIRQLIALAKTQPGALNFSCGDAGGSPHLAGELFKAMSQTNIVTVRYKGTSPAVTATIAGEVHLMFPTVSTGMPGVKSGRLRALAVTSVRPSPLAPGLPTVSDTGLPGYESSSAYVVFAPAKTPVPTIERLHRAIVQYFQTPEIKDRLFRLGLETVASSPQELAIAMTADLEKMGKIIRDSGIRAN